MCMVKVHKCPYCGSDKTTWRGYRYTRRTGKKHLRICTRCRRKFTPDDGFLRRHYKKEYIVEAVSLRVNGLSLSKTIDHMWQIHGIGITRKTLIDWTRYYSKLIRKFTDKLKPEVKGTVHADEVVVKVKGKKAYYWGAKDRKTKYKLAKELTRRRTYKNGAKKIFHKLKHGCKNIPEKVVSDKLGHYKKGHNKYLRGQSELVHGVPIACKKYGLEHNNNSAERDNERIKEHTKTMRGGFRTIWTGKDMLFLVDNHYNFVRPHMGLNGGTPAEAAGIDLKLRRNKLLYLIKFL